MSNYSDNVEAIEQVTIPEFYLFSSGSTIERYTNQPQSLVFIGETFEAATIKRSKITRNVQLGVNKMTIASPLTETMAKYIPNQPIEPMTVSVFRSVYTDLTSYVLFFRGKVMKTQIADNAVIAFLESKNKILTRKVPKAIYQSYCNHSLFDSGCSLDSFTYRRTAIVSSISADGSTITLAFNDGKASPSTDYFVGGTVKYGTDIRLIITHSVANQIKIHIPFDSRVSTGVELNIYPGCDGAATTCINTFNNLTNFFGMAYIPSVNPILWGFPK